MPELPEVETVVRQLAPLVVGRRIVAFEVFDPKLEFKQTRKVTGRTIAGVQRLGKQILLELEPDDPDRPHYWQCIHLRMTGRLIWRDEDPDGLKRPSKPSPLRARWRFEEGTLLFNDTRRFGTLRLLEDPYDAAPDGQDPTDPNFTPAVFKELIGQSHTPIKPWLLRQDRLVGVGNIYASEALFEAGIHPARPAASLSGAEIKALHRSLRAVLARAIKAGGTTFSDFQNARGDVGNYQFNLKVYDRAGEPCPRCGGGLERFVQQQRSTFFCAKCQHAPSGKSKTAREGVR